MKHFECVKSVQATEMISDFSIDAQHYYAMEKKDFINLLARWIALSIDSEDVDESQIAEELRDIGVSLHICNIRFTVGDYDLAVTREDYGDNECFFKAGLYIVEDVFDVEELTEF